MENSCIRYIANYISARIFMYVHKISFNELYVMPLCPFHSLKFFLFILYIYLKYMYYIIIMYISH